MRINIQRWTLLSLFLLLVSTAFGAEGRFVQLTGWGGGKPEEIVPQAAAVGFDEIIVGSRDPQYLGQLVALGQKHKIGIYNWITLGDARDWKKRRPNANPPLQEMNAAENAALERIQADKTKGKSSYQYGGEPVQGIEVLQTPLLCFHHPEVQPFFEEQIRDLLRTPGLRGIAMDFFGYQNYRCCRCPTSMKAFEAWHRWHSGLPRDKALDRFSLETLVDFVNGLARYARSVRADAKVTCHVYLRKLEGLVATTAQRQPAAADVGRQTLAKARQWAEGMSGSTNYTIAAIQLEKSPGWSWSATESWLSRQPGSDLPLAIHFKTGLQDGQYDLWLRVYDAKAYHGREYSRWKVNGKAYASSGEDLQGPVSINAGQVKVRGGVCSFNLSPVAGDYGVIVYGVGLSRSASGKSEGLYSLRHEIADAIERLEGLVVHD